MQITARFSWTVGDYNVYKYVNTCLAKLPETGNTDGDASQIRRAN